MCETLGFHVFLHKSLIIAMYAIYMLSKSTSLKGKLQLLMRDLSALYVLCCEQ
jgi:hypothetical protein